VSNTSLGSENPFFIFHLWDVDAMQFSCVARILNKYHTNFLAKLSDKLRWGASLPRNFLRKIKGKILNKLRLNDYDWLTNKRALILLVCLSCWYCARSYQCRVAPQAISPLWTNYNCLVLFLPVKPNYALGWMQYVGYWKLFSSLS
jgi:hypothetical protein